MLAFPDAPLTVFAPTDDAFNALPPDEFFSALLDIRKLSSIVSNHLATSASTVQTIFSPNLCWQNFKVLSGKTVSILPIIIEHASLILKQIVL